MVYTIIVLEAHDQGPSIKYIKLELKWINKQVNNQVTRVWDGVREEGWNSGIERKVSLFLRVILLPHPSDSLYNCINFSRNRLAGPWLYSPAYINQTPNQADPRHRARGEDYSVRDSLTFPFAVADPDRKIRGGGGGLKKIWGDRAPRAPPLDPPLVRKTNPFSASTYQK